MPANFGPDPQNPGDYKLINNPDGVSESLSVNGPAQTATVTDEDGTQYLFALVNPVTGYYSTLKTISYRGGYVQTLTFDVATNRLTSVTDNLGRSLGFVYGSVGQLTALTANGATVATYTYTDLSTQALAQAASYFGGVLPSQMLGTVLTLGSATRTGTNETTSYSYGLPPASQTNLDNIFMLTGVTDARGKVYSTWQFDPQDRAVSNTLGGYQTTGLVYNANGSTTVTNALGEQTIFSTSASANNNLLLTQKQQQAIGSLPVATTSYLYDANDMLAQVTNVEDARVTKYVNDPATALPTSITRGFGSPSASTSTYTWNTVWRVPTQVVEPGRTTAYAWSALGQLNSQTQTDTTSTTIPYSTNGQVRTWGYAYWPTTNLLKTVTDPLNNTVGYAYNSSNYIQSITDQLGHVTTITAWNALGQPISLTDPNGIITTLAYDGDGRLKSVTNGAPGPTATTKIDYDGVGNVKMITEPNLAWTSYSYDNARRLTGMTNADGDSATWTRDAMGDATAISLKSGASGTVAFSKSQTFDQLGRLIQSIGFAGQTYTFGYDHTDNVTSVADPRSYVFSNSFDALNRLISQTDEGGVSGNTVNLTRSGVDDITAYQDPRLLTTSYVRNGFGEIIQEVSPDRGTTTYWRDALGHVSKRTDARGVTFTYTYDAAGRILTEANAGNSSDNVTYQYDQTGHGNGAIGRLTTIIDGSGTTLRSYGGKGNLVSESRAIGTAPSLTISYGFDLSQNMTQMVLPSGRQINWTRDAMGRVSQVAVVGGTGFPTSVNVASPIVYNPYGHPASLTFGNGLIETYGVNTDYHIASFKLAPTIGAAVINRTLAWTGETLDSIADAAVPGNSETLTYSKRHALNAATGPYGALSWTYDVDHNRLTQTVNGVAQTYAYPSNSNQLSSIVQSGAPSRLFGYDAAGNRTSDVMAGSPALAEQYDGHGNLSAYLSAGVTQGAYSYDAFQHLAKRVVTSGVAAGTRQYLYDPAGHVVVETDQNGVSTREYIWLDDMPIGVIDQVNTTPVLYYVHADHLDRPVMMTNAAKANVWSAVWSPFGAAQTITGSLTMNGRFPGQWFQIESGLHWNWHRHYDPSTGGYLQADPYSTELRDQTQAGVMPADAVRNFYDGIARSGAGTFVGALPQIPVVAADLLEQVGDPTKGGALGSAVFPDGPNRYEYAGQSPETRVDSSGLLNPWFNFGRATIFGKDHCIYRNFLTGKVGGASVAVGGICPPCPDPG